MRDGCEHGSFSYSHSRRLLFSSTRSNRPKTHAWTSRHQLQVSSDNKPWTSKAVHSLFGPDDTQTSFIIACNQSNALCQRYSSHRKQYNSVPRTLGFNRSRKTLGRSRPLRSKRINSTKRTGCKIHSPCHYLQRRRLHFHPPPQIFSVDERNTEGILPSSKRITAHQKTTSDCGQIRHLYRSLAVCRRIFTRALDICQNPLIMHFSSNLERKPLSTEPARARLTDSTTFPSRLDLKA